MLCETSAFIASAQVYANRIALSVDQLHDSLFGNNFSDFLDEVQVKRVLICPAVVGALSQQLWEDQVLLITNTKECFLPKVSLFVHCFQF